MPDEREGGYSIWVVRALATAKQAGDGSFQRCCDDLLAVFGPDMTSMYMQQLDHLESELAGSVMHGADRSASAITIHDTDSEGSAAGTRAETAAEAYADTRLALKVRAPYIDQILDGSKRIEIRSGPCAHAERITLIEVGSKLIKGRVTVRRSRQMTSAEKQQHASVLSKLGYKNPWAWELHDPEVVDPPILVPDAVGKNIVTWVPRMRWEKWERGQAAVPCPGQAKTHAPGRSLVQKWRAQLESRRPVQKLSAPPAQGRCRSYLHLKEEPMSNSEGASTVVSLQVLEGMLGVWAYAAAAVHGATRLSIARAGRGYFVHTDMIRFTFKTHPVEQQIAGLPSRKERRRARRAFRWLMQQGISAYRDFVDLHRAFLRQTDARAASDASTPRTARLPVSFLETVGLECALWPDLYWRTNMTETYARSRDVRRRQETTGAAGEQDAETDEEDAQTRGRQSAKASFLAKALGPLLGYSADRALVHYVYDLWLWSSIGGARNAVNLGVREALASKSFSPELWRRNHAALVDLQRQHGLPSLFITVAPFEPSFPYHIWTQDELEKNLRTRTNLPLAETLHIAHVLTQVLKGFLCGHGDDKTSHKERRGGYVFTGGRNSGCVRAWVGRLEFQDGKRLRHNYGKQQAYHGSGRVHLHCLVWLRGAASLDLPSKVRADIPREAAEPELRCLVRDSQLDWNHSGWPLREEPSQYDKSSKLLRLRHPQDAFDQHCRAYFPDLLQSLRCHMDVQASDGRSLVLKYCCSNSLSLTFDHGYLPKFSDSFAHELLSNEASTFELTRRILCEYHPLEPEMVCQLAGGHIPQFFCSGVVRKFVVPVPWDKPELPRIVELYRVCSWRTVGMSLLDYLRKTNNKGGIQQRYVRKHRRAGVKESLQDWIKDVRPDGSVLVALVMYSRYNDKFFGQWLLLHYPFRQLEQLWDERVQKVPASLRFLTLCLLKAPTYWRDLRNLEADLELEAQSQLYVQNLLAMVAARIELADAYLSGEISIVDFPNEISLLGGKLTDTGVELAADQLAVLARLRRNVGVALEARWPEDADHVTPWIRWMEQDTAVNEALAVLGPAGSGKSTAVEVAARESMRVGARVGIACPTGMLTSRYRHRFPDADVDTIHGMFALHRAESETLDLMTTYDLVIIDEVGQLSESIFERLMRLWYAAMRRPVLCFVGDFAQLRSIEGTSPRQSPWWRQVRRMHLRTMRRCKCERLRWKLELLRRAKPTKKQLHDILRGHRAPMHRPQGHATIPTLAEIEQIFAEAKSARRRPLFVALSRRGADHLNRLAVSALFSQSTPLTRLPCDPDANLDNFQGQQQVAAEPMDTDIFDGMRVLLTVNEDKVHGFVNGMLGVVRRVRRNAVEVLTDAGEVLAVHPVTREVEVAGGGTRRITYYPMRAGYATTLYKVQGSTLESIVMWFDVPYVEAAAYVALSRVQFDSQWSFLGDVTTAHCVPARTD
ncbi:unnamed protein product [Symbiodinium sp. CCMP2592]|nr:unnamed protein product [Symbiodinium sp. CCMP2592]